MSYTERDNPRILLAQAIDSLLREDHEGLLDEEGQNKFWKAEGSWGDEGYDKLAKAADVFLDQSEADYSIEGEINEDYWKAAGYDSREELRDRLEDPQTGPNWTGNYSRVSSAGEFFATQRGPLNT